MAMVDGTGTGVFADDLDGDGLIDLVLPNLSGETAVFFNEGHLVFDRKVLAPSGRFRQATAADLDGDGDRDLVLSTGVGPPLPFYADTDRGPWRRGELRDIPLFTFSLSPGDLEGDGDVDWVTSSYNAELTASRNPRALNKVDIGTGVHRPVGDGFESELLTTSAQALVSLIVDVDGDGTQDVVAGNDLGTPDRIWLGGPQGLTLTELFDTTTLSTMSIDVGDLDNDGDHDLVATDMKPLPGEPLERWEGVLDDIEAARVDDIQQPVNVVQQRDDAGRYDEMAADFGVDATGWSWAGLLGDLDNDGLQDLYIVNGMQAVGIFDQLPDAALVQPNQAFRNVGEGFESAPDWGLGDRAGGRGMAEADLDNDGDLDIIVNNLGAPARIWENQLCGGEAVVVEPTWSGAQNLDALGASVTVTDGPRQYLRLVTGSRGYLSTSPTRAHVGLGEAPGDVEVAITWPDGAVTIIDDVAPGTLLTVDREAGPLAAGEVTP